MNRLALSWIDTALALEEENREARVWIERALELDAQNRELREICTALLFQLAREREVFAYARGEIDERFGETA